jgi:hypothetical protein
MRASLLFYRKLRNKFKAFVSKENPYDPCIANKDVGKGEQMTIN